MRNRILFSIILFISVNNASADKIDDTQRIVSLAPSNTCMVRDLGLAECLVGITKFCPRLDNATDAVVIGTLSLPNLELITTLTPTLVLGDVESNRSATLHRLESLGLHVVRLGPSRNLQDIVRDFKRVAEITGREQYADVYLKSVKERLRNIEKKIGKKKRKRVFVEVWTKPLMTVSKDSFIHSIIETAGGINVFADAPAAYPRISIESVIAVEPDVIVILTHSLIDDTRIKRYQEFSVLDDTLIVQTDATEMTQPSLSTFLKSTEHFANILHSDLFTETENKVPCCCKKR